MKHSDIIKKIRTETDLSQQKFADKIGVSFSIINKIEQDAGKIKYDLAKKLNEKFGYNIDALLAGELIKEEKKEVTREKWLDRLTESELQTLEKITKEDKAALILFLDIINGDIAKIDLLSQYLKSRYTVNISK